MNSKQAVKEAFWNIYDLVGDFSIELEIYLELLNEHLDMLKQEDYFGTEGQCDPRKDWRNNV